MQKLLIAAIAAALAGAAHAQPQPKDRAATQQPADAPADADARTRARADGAAGGTGERAAKGGPDNPRASAGASAGEGPNIKDQRPKRAKKGRVHNENSSEREAGRGAR